MFSLKLFLFHSYFQVTFCSSRLHISKNDNFFHNSKIMEFMRLINVKINQALVEGPTYVILWLIDWLIDLITMHDWFILFLNMHITILCSSLTPFMIAHCGSWPRYAFANSDHSLYIFWFSYMHDWREYPLIFLLIVTSASFY